MMLFSDWRMIKQYILILTLLLGTVLGGAKTACETCGKKARRLPYFLNNVFYCSKKCIPADKKCALCGSPLLGRYMYCYDLLGNRLNYCETCSHKPKCPSCTMPVDVRKGDEARPFCAFCRNELVTKPLAVKLLRQLRQEMAEKYHYDTQHPISVEIVDRNTMTKISGQPNAGGCTKFDMRKTVRQRGKQKTVQIRYKTTIYLLDTLARVPHISSVLVHELTHDFLFRIMGQGTDERITEGICETMAADWALRHGYKGIFTRIKTNPDTVYGGGFRLVYPQFQRGGLKGVLEHYRSCFRRFR